MRCKIKGLDFHRIVDDHVIEKLRNARPEVYKSLREKAISGSGFHQKLFSQLVGDYKERQEVDHKVTGLFAVVGSDPNIIPKDIVENDKVIKPDGKQIIDIDYED